MSTVYALLKINEKGDIVHGGFYGEPTPTLADLRCVWAQLYKLEDHTYELACRRMIKLIVNHHPGVARRWFAKEIAQWA